MDDNLDSLAQSLIEGNVQTEDILTAASQPMQVEPAQYDTVNATSETAPAVNAADFLYRGLDKIQAFTQPALDEALTDGVPRDTGLGALPGNFVLDTVDFGKGIGGLAGLYLQRGRETFLEGSPPIRLLDHPVRRNGKTVVLPSDVTSAGVIGSAILSDAKHTYVDPFINKGFVGGISDVAGYANRHPLFFAGDASMVGSVASKALKGTRLAEEAARLKDAGKAKIIDALPSGIKTSMAANEAARPAAEGYANAMRRAATVFDDMMEPLWKNLTKAEQREMRAYTEGWHPDMINGAGVSPAVQSFLDATETITQQMGKILTDAGVATAEQMEAARYLPFIIENTRLADGTKVFKDVAEITKNPALMNQYVQMAKEMLDAVGVRPHYNPWITDAEAAATISNPTKLSGGAFKEAVRQVFDPEKETKFSRFMEKSSSGEHVGKTHIKNMKAAFLQLNQFDAAIHQILKQAINGINNPSLYKGPLKKLKIEGNELIDRHLTTILDLPPTMPGASVAKALGKELVLPASVHDALMKMITAPEKVQKNWYGKWANTQRRNLLAFNPLYAKAQGVQQAFQLMLFQFNGPRDIIPSIWSWALGSQRELRAMISEELVQNVMLTEEMSGPGRLFEGAGKAVNGVAKASAEGLAGNPDLYFNGLTGRIEKLGQAAEDIGRGIDRIGDMNLNESAVYDAAARSVATIYYLNQLAATDSKAAKVFNGIVDTVEMKRRLELLRQSPELQAQIKQKVDTVLGDFRQMNTPMQEAFRSSILWWNYYREFSKFYLAFVKEHPYKNATLQHFAAVEPYLYGDEDMPDWAKGGVIVRGSEQPDGRILADVRGSLSPLATIGEFGQLIQAVGGTDTQDTGQAITSLNGLLSMLIVATGRNPSSMRPFRDYSLAANSSGQSFDPGELDKGIYNPKTVTPDLIAYIARSLMPFMTKTAERLFERFASGGEPSQFTSVMPVRVERGRAILELKLGPKSAPKRNAYGEVRKQRPLLESLDEFLNMAPLQLDLEQERKTKSYRAEEIRRLMRQSGRRGLYD